jgi:guanine deaminase
MEIKKAMTLAIEEAKKTMNDDIGGPFGAAIISPEGKIVAVASNAVLDSHDPTAHAEINVIRKATAHIQNHDLSGYTLITTAYPCPMCLGAIMWANIKEVYYGCNLEDAASIGFRDDLMYQVIHDINQHKDILSLKSSERDACIKLFKEYHEKNKTMY